MNMTLEKSHLIFALAVVVAVFSACCSIAQAREENSSGTKKIRIGLTMDTLKEERWQKDRDLFEKRAEELRAEVIVQSADGNDETQVKQAESLLTQGVDVLVVIPHNAEVAAT